jgi:hypothetical protein
MTTGLHEWIKVDKINIPVKTKQEEGIKATFDI